MAIYHFSAKVISRAAGSSALAAAAYRSGSRLFDERLDRNHDFSNKAGVVHSEVLMPDGAPEHLGDRQVLWNAVEAAEVRKDAQLAREIEFTLPRELDQAEGIRLARDFVAREFVARGMIADLNVHWDIGADGEPKPHAHVMLTMREVGEGGFGSKVREWNRTELLEHWREAWAGHVNTRLAELDIDARIDHRSLEAQGIELEPQHKIGPAASRMELQGQPSERAEEHREIARRNGAKLLADPNLALDAITRQQATFTRHDVAKFVHRHSDGKEQFDRIFAAIRASNEVVYAGKDGRGEERFTSRAMLATEKRLERAVDRLALRRHHGLPAEAIGRAIASAGSGGLSLGGDQQAVVGRILTGSDLANVVGYAGTGKSAMLGVARDAWQRAGYRVQGAALSGIAAENLEAGSGIASRTLASLEHQWAQGRELLTDRDVLVIDEAGMIGTRQMERVLSEAEKRGAKVVLVGDPEQLQAIEAGAAFRSIAERHGAHELTTVRRQRAAWQRDATRWLATERTAEAIAAYADHGAVHAAPTREQARSALIERWDRERSASPNASRIILTHTNEEVQALNGLARERMHAAGALRDEVAVGTERGVRPFARGDRVLFLRNDRGLGVKNGSLGTVESVGAARMAVLLDDGRSVAFDLKGYAQIDHGYAATIHKAQGMTVDRVHVLATPGLDRHSAYVALSRHRNGVDLHYGRDDFADQGKLVRGLSRERGKDMASDYAREPAERAPASRYSESSLGAAVARHGRIVRAMLFAKSIEAPFTPEQRGELAGSRAALTAAGRHAVHDLEAAMAATPGLVDEAAAGRTRNAIATMNLEAQMRSDPQVRADVFVQRWQALDRHRRLLLRDHETADAGKVADRMVTMAKQLERDPQLESLLRNRNAEFELPALDRGQSVGQALADLVGRGRSRGIGIGM